MKCAVLGAGAWGTTIAHTLAYETNNQVMLWTHESDVIQSCRERKENIKYLPGYIISSQLTVTNDLFQTLHKADLIFLAVPVQYSQEIIKKASLHVSEQQPWVVLSKGIIYQTMQFPYDCIKNICNTNQIALCMGPSFAVDLMQHQITACMIATDALSLYDKLKSVFTRDYLQLFHTYDIQGVSWCAALKNIIALGMGVLTGLSYTDNTKCYFLTRILHELSLVVTCAGGLQETMLGLAGVGDIVLTAYSAKSKNFKAGLAIAQGMKVQEYCATYVHVPESFNTVLLIKDIEKKYNLHLPLLQFFSDLVQGKVQAQDLILLLRY